MFLLSRSLNEIFTKPGAGNSPATLRILTAARFQSKPLPLTEGIECEQSSRLLLVPSMEENGAYIVQLELQGLDLPMPSPHLANLCRFLALACHGRTNREAAPRPTDALHRAIWQGVPCVRPGGRSPPLHLVSARRCARSIVRW